jgi:nicotinamide riboside kinase
MSAPRRICLIGAECTGKTVLGKALAREFKCPYVAEYLREFCDEHQRTPREDEQQWIIDTQMIRETIAMSDAETLQSKFVICDTAPLLTAVYSDYIFADTSLYARAIEWHRNYALTLLLEPDLPWIADGIQRDGEHAREPAHKLIRKKLSGHRFNYVEISGSGHERTLAALRAVSAIATT